MRTKVFFCFILFSSVLAAHAQGTAFTYQGRLNDGSGSANGAYDLRFAIFNALTNGTEIAGPITNSATSVSNGLFMATLDFGPIFTGTKYWLEIAVRTNGGGAFTTLVPRQEITPTPYAEMATTASNLLGPLPSTDLSGTYNGAVTLNNGLNEFYGTFNGDFYGPSFIGGSFSGMHFGDGSGLYNLNPAALSGPIPNAFLTNAWKTTGNAGTTPGPNFLGTTDNQALELHVNGTRALTLFPDETTNNAPNIVIGSPSNAITGTLTGTTIGGGGWNTIGPFSLFSTNNPYGDTSYFGPLNASYSTIGGGFLNQIQAYATFSTIGGGALNTIQYYDVESTIGGGFGNTISNGGSWSAIAGGTHHNIASQNGFIGGGWENSILLNSSYSAIGGGNLNVMQKNAFYSFIGGGYGNTLGPDGLTNQNSGGYESVIGGGYNNSIYEYGSFIGGGWFNSIQPLAGLSVIGGGYYNYIYGTSNGEYAVIAGGLDNVVQSNSPYSAIGGGQQNGIYVNSSNSVIGGGQQNGIFAYSPFSVIEGGQQNDIYGNSPYSVISGGSSNVIEPNAFGAAIPGGYNNFAGGTGSFAAGTYADALNNGTFVWSDNSSTNAFYSTSSNQFLIRATDGVGIGTNYPTAALHVVAPGGGTNIALRVANGPMAFSGIGINTPTAAFVQLANATNTPSGSYITTIYNPICDNDPNALLFVTHSWNPPGVAGNYETNTFSVYYSAPHWTIYNDNKVPILGMSFNVLIVKP